MSTLPNVGAFRRECTSATSSKRTSACTRNPPSLRRQTQGSPQHQKKIARSRDDKIQGTTEDKVTVLAARPTDLGRRARSGLALAPRPPRCFGGAGHPRPDHGSRCPRGNRSVPARRRKQPGHGPPQPIFEIFRVRMGDFESISLTLSGQSGAEMRAGKGIGEAILQEEPLAERGNRCRAGWGMNLRALPGAGENRPVPAVSKDPNKPSGSACRDRRDGSAASAGVRGLQLQALDHERHQGLPAVEAQVTGEGVQVVAEAFAR
jgi:hypothetical protein